MTGLRRLLLAALAVPLAACGSDDGATTAIGATSGGSTGTGGANGSTGTGGANGAPAGAIVVNEIQADFDLAPGSEWLEIANASNDTIDLSDHGVCDEDESGNCAFLSAIRFPATTTLASNGYIVIITHVEMDWRPGPQSSCHALNVSSCYYAPWDIDKSGETIRVIDPDNTEIALLEYPPDAQGAMAGLNSWSRIPDLTGDPAVTPRTPGAANTQ